MRFSGPRGHTFDTSYESLTIEEMLAILRDWEQEPNCRDSLDPSVARALRKNLYVLIQRAVYEGKSTRPQHLNKLIRSDLDLALYSPIAV